VFRLLEENGSGRQGHVKHRGPLGKMKKSRNSVIIRGKERRGLEGIFLRFLLKREKVRTKPSREE